MEEIIIDDTRRVCLERRSGFDRAQRKQEKTVRGIIFIKRDTTVKFRVAKRVHFRATAPRVFLIITCALDAFSRHSRI